MRNRFWRSFYDRTAYGSMALAGWEEYKERLCCRLVTSSTVGYATRPTGQLPGLDFHQQERQPLSAAP